jgi:2-oxoglutarate ferredoxin oxidoreductase subunit alpha
LVPVKKVEPKMVVNGTEAVGLGAIAGGMQFAAIYPMSPISNILQVLALYQEKYGYIYKQPEDEISAVNMAIGAAFAGARSMTATSGGGFCLMTSSGLAARRKPP